MKAMPCNDDAFGPGTIRADGRKLCPSYLFEVKAPRESRGRWDYYKLLQTTPAEEAFRPSPRAIAPSSARKGGAFSPLAAGPRNNPLGPAANAS